MSTLNAIMGAVVDSTVPQAVLTGLDVEQGPSTTEEIFISWEESTANHNRY